MSILLLLHLQRGLGLGVIETAYGAVLGPWAIRRLGVGDMPTEETVPAPRG